MSFSLGAGIIIMKEDKVLLVQMNYSRFKGHWILPGGMVDPGEHPHQAALRELKEETGQVAQVDQLVTIRHRLKEDKRSNSYWVFKGTLTEESPLIWDEEELQSVKYWSIPDLMKDEFVRAHTKFYIELLINGKERLEKPTHLDSDWEDFVY